MIALLFCLHIHLYTHLIKSAPALLIFHAATVDGRRGGNQERDEMRFAGSYESASMRGNYTDHDRGSAV